MEERNERNYPPGVNLVRIITDFFVVVQIFGIFMVCYCIVSRTRVKDCGPCKLR